MLDTEEWEDDAVGSRLILEDISFLYSSELIMASPQQLLFLDRFILVSSSRGCFFFNHRNDLSSLTKK